VAQHEALAATRVSVVARCVQAERRGVAVLCIAAVAEVDGDAFAVWLIPTTLEVTNVRARGVGQSVNLEFDLLGKYVEKLLNIRSP
jgi:riboflavin synthase alpha subunit